jgi:transcriptional regulator with XRE-family HTH domain
MESMKHPGPLIRSLRREAGVTQRQLAARMGTTQSAIAAIERDDANLTWRTVADALDALGYRPQISAAPKPPGVDESLIRQQLELTPAERLRSLERQSATMRRLTMAGAQSRGELP